MASAVSLEPGQEAGRKLYSASPAAATEMGADAAGFLYLTLTRLVRCKGQPGPLLLARNLLY